MNKKQLYLLIPSVIFLILAILSYQALVKCGGFDRNYWGGGLCWMGVDGLTFPWTVFDHSLTLPRVIIEVLINAVLIYFSFSYAIKTILSLKNKERVKWPVLAAINILLLLGFFSLYIFFYINFYLK